MSKKSAKIAAMIESFQGSENDPHYLGYFDCFNHGLYYEAHDVLEELWLTQGKGGANYAFFKGLIQLAGAFVHLQKNRLRPAAALFKLARTNLQSYATPHEQLDLTTTLELIEHWLGALEQAQFSINPFSSDPPPRLCLQPPVRS